MTIGVRLREERERLGLSQPAFAAVAGTTKQTLFSWETGKTAPDGFQLAQFAGSGVDVLYILTGQRTPALLSPDESLVIQMYRSAAAPVRAAALGALVGAAAPGQTMSNAGSGNVQAGNVQGGISTGPATRKRTVRKRE